MYRVSVRAPFGSRCVVLALLSAIFVLSFAADPAQARWRKRSAPAADSAAIKSEPRYADIVVDANSGDVLHAVNADSQRHPASLTKIMTLYLLFERLEGGKLKLSAPLDVSSNAAEQAPSKLGLKPGQDIDVEDAIKALVTKSANDVAVVIAETIAGSEEEFAKLMTRKALALGMTRTVYKNASGLPDDDQVTTARDQALLALAIQERFPRLYKYFSTARFLYRGNWLRNHNHLLGNVEGVDGIKTGYTHASGFNLVSSVRRGKRHIVAVVFGGNTASQRDARMRQLIEAHVDDAAQKHTAPKIAEREPAEPKAKVQVASAAPAAPVKIEKPEAARARAQPTPPAARNDGATTATIPVPRPAAGSTDPIKPHLVKTLSVKSAATHNAAISPLMLSPQPVMSQAHAAMALAADNPPPPPPGAQPGLLGVLPVKTAEMVPAPVAHSAPAPIAPVAPAPVAHPASIAASPAQLIPAAAPAGAARARKGWIIQVGAFDDENEAKQRLTAAKDRAAKLLASADPFTEPVVKGVKTLYRARFAGLKQDTAEAACRQLKRSDIACMAIRN